MGQIVHPAILCGGSGTRLWPLSTSQMPKQFLALTSSKSMLEETVDRVKTSLNPEISFAPPLVIGSNRHIQYLDRALPNGRKILEPVGRNSAPAIAATCLAFDPQDLILALPADHDIRDVKAFHDAVAAATGAAQAGAIATFGIQPTYPATEYGYIKAISVGALNTPIAIEGFVEKPDLAAAKTYLEDGCYFWNAGIFLFKAGTMLDALKTYAPDVLSGVRAATPDITSDKIHLAAEPFGKTPNISIDYAVMEKARNIVTVPVKMGWNDVGSFQALHNLLTNSESENLLHGPVVADESDGLYVRSEGPAVNIKGVSNLVIVATPNEIMITPMNDSKAAQAFGTDARLALDNHGVAQPLVDATREWLWESLEVWANMGWDSEGAGFVEQMSATGTPIQKKTRRVIVQAKQVYSFAKAIEMGWRGQEIAHRLVNQGISYLQSWNRQSDGGYAHVTGTPDAANDNHHVLSDHAALILAGSVAYKATGAGAALRIADEAIAFIDAALEDKDHGGWFENRLKNSRRTAQSHLHLFQAMLAYHDAVGCDHALARASEIVRLFETHFFNPANDVLVDSFDFDWGCRLKNERAPFNPGHHYRWATLLCMYDGITGHDSESWRKRLIKSADAFGRNAKTGFAVNRSLSDGTVTDGNSCLHQQTEMLRAWACHTASHNPSDSQTLLDKIYNVFLTRGPVGGWIDEVDPRNRPISGRVSAATFSQVISALAPVISVGSTPRL